MSEAKQSTMVVAAARELCRQHAKMCNVNGDDCWNAYADEFMTEAKLLLDAAGVPALVIALQALLELERRDRLMPIGREWDAARAAIAKATGS